MAAAPTVAATATVGTAVMAFVMTRRLGRRVQGIADAARRYRDGDFTPSRLEHRDDELGTVARALDETVGNLAARIAELDTTQAAVAAKANLSTQRFGNYVQGTRTPDVATLARIAKALDTSTDYLLGLTDDADELLNSLEPILLRLFELEGLPPDRSETIVLIAREALRLLRGLQDEGDAHSRSRLAAQAAWQIRSSLKPS